MDKLFGNKSKGKNAGGPPATKQTGLFGQAPKLPKNLEGHEENEEMDGDDIDQNIANKANEKPKYVPWVEKYRPSKIEEVSHQVEVVQALKVSVKTGQVPHLLLYGPPGTGKTSTILAMAQELFGKEHYKNRILELNASDERGIQVVREKIKRFAQRKISKNPDSNCPPIQICILDEADSMTIDAQAALRRIIEAYSTNTRFCIICNYISKIIDPLASRCVKFRFSPISNDAQKDRLMMICKNESINLQSPDVLDSLIKISDGDLRRSINTIQTCSSFTKDNSKSLTIDDIQKISGVVPDDVIETIYRRIMESGGYSDIQDLAQGLILDGYDVQQLIVRLMEHYIKRPSQEVPDLCKAKISELVAETDFKMIQGGDEELNLLQTLSSISMVVHG